MISSLNPGMNFSLEASRSSFSFSSSFYSLDEGYYCYLFCYSDSSSKKFSRSAMFTTSAKKFWLICICSDFLPQVHYFT